MIKKLFFLIWLQLLVFISLPSEWNPQTIRAMPLIFTKNSYSQLPFKLCIHKNQGQSKFKQYACAVQKLSVGMALTAEDLKNPNRMILQKKVARAKNLFKYKFVSLYIFYLIARIQTTFFINLMQQSTKSSSLATIVLMLALLTSVHAFNCPNPYSFFDSDYQCIFYADNQNNSCASFNFTGCSWREDKDRIFAQDWRMCTKKCCGGGSFDKYSPSWDSVNACQERIFLTKQITEQKSIIRELNYSEWPLKWAIFSLLQIFVILAVSLAFQCRDRKRLQQRLQKQRLQKK